MTIEGKNNHMKFNAIINVDDVHEMFNIDFNNAENTAIENGFTNAINHQEVGKMRYKHKNFKGFYISEWESVFNNNLTIEGAMDKPVFSLHFILQGQGCYAMADFETETSGGQSNMWIFQAGSKGGSSYKKESPFTSWAVNFDKSYFHDLVNRYPELLEDLYKRYRIGESFHWHPKHIRITPEVLNIIQQIENASMMGTSRTLYTEAKVQELLALQLECACAQTRISNTGIKTANDTDKIHEAKDVLLKDLNKPPTICELARIVGINEKKLKYGFREVYSQTVYGCLFEHKMNLARQLLLNTNKSIYEIALECGYDYASHFTTAFKRKYGLTPKCFRAAV
jgi:AraC-like DNA-binding protein